MVIHVTWRGKSGHRDCCTWLNSSRDGAVKTPRCLGRNRSRGAEGKTFPSHHAPVVIDLNSPGCPFDAGWASAESRIAARLEKQRCIGRESRNIPQTRSSAVQTKTLDLLLTLPLADVLNLGHTGRCEAGSLSPQSVGFRSRGRAGHSEADRGSVTRSAERNQFRASPQQTHASSGIRRP